MLKNVEKTIDLRVKLGQYIKKSRTEEENAERKLIFGISKKI